MSVTILRMIFFFGIKMFEWIEIRQGLSSKLKDQN